MAQPPTVDDAHVVARYVDSIDLGRMPTDIAARTWTQGRRSRTRRRAAAGVVAAAVLAPAGYAMSVAVGGDGSAAPVADPSPSGRFEFERGIDAHRCAGGVSTAFRYPAGVSGYPSALLAVRAEEPDDVRLSRYRGPDGAVLVDVDGETVVRTYRAEKLDGGWEIVSVETCIEPSTSDS
ncbi:hypothetical protein GCM10027062_45840 [Nocardioides hungaricus]